MEVLQHKLCNFEFINTYNHKEVFDEVNRILNLTCSHRVKSQKIANFYKMVINYPNLVIVVRRKFGGIYGVLYCELNCDVHYLGSLKLQTVFNEHAAMTRNMMPEVLKDYVKYVFDNFPTHKIIAEINTDKQLLQKLVQLAGFNLEGCLRKEGLDGNDERCDVLYYGLLVSDLLES